MLRWLRTGAGAIGAGLFATLFVVFLVQITARFGFDRPLPWTALSTLHQVRCKVPL